MHNKSLLRINTLWKYIEQCSNNDAMPSFPYKNNNSTIILFKTSWLRRKKYLSKRTLNHEEKSRCSFFVPLIVHCDNTYCQMRKKIPKPGPFKCLYTFSSDKFLSILNRNLLLNLFIDVTDVYQITTRLCIYMIIFDLCVWSRVMGKTDACLYFNLHHM